VKAAISSKADALAELAQALTKAGDTGQALSIARQALAIAKSLPNDEDKAWTLSVMAKVLALAGH
jgi:hypothetical protein